MPLTIKILAAIVLALVGCNSAWSPPTAPATGTYKATVMGEDGKVAKVIEAEVTGEENSKSGIEAVADPQGGVSFATSGSSPRTHMRDLSGAFWWGVMFVAFGAIAFWGRIYFPMIPISMCLAAIVSGGGMIFAAKIIESVSTGMIVGAGFVATVLFGVPGLWDNIVKLRSEPDGR